MGTRARIAAMLAALAGVVASGCGSSHRPSALDPARVVPANAIVYAEATVRPQGAQHDALESALTKLLGHSPDREIERAVDRSLSRSGLSYKHDIQPWLGQRIAFVATAFSRAGIAAIAATNDPRAAVATLTRAEQRHGPLVKQTYAGIAYKVATYRGTALAFGAVGHFAVIGGTSAFRQIVDTYRARAPSLKPPGSGALAQAYVNGPRVVAGVTALPTFPPAVRQRLRTVLASTHLPRAFSLSLSASPHAFAADFRSIGAPTSRTSAGGADVSGLPADSWLAISTGRSFSRQFATGFSGGFIQGFSRAARASGVNPSIVLQQLRRRTGIDVFHDLLPALGPFQFSVQGSTLTTLASSLALYPSDPAAGARLVADIHNLVARDRNLRVTGGSRAFNFGPASLPIPLVAVSISVVRSSPGSL